MVCFRRMVIAIDGYSSTGKSTLAKDLAMQLDFAYVDTGAMYRAVTLYMIQHNIALEDTPSINKMLSEISIKFSRIDGQNTTFLNDVNVEQEIRGKAVSDLVSPVATIAIIRENLVSLQQAMASNCKGLVMDGRDIGTVVFPEAEYKFFITSNIETRANRRLLELQSKGIDITIEEVKSNLTKRDEIDSSRAHSPLKKAADAVVIDNSNLTKEQQLAHILNLIKH